MDYAQPVWIAPAFYLVALHLFACITPRAVAQTAAQENATTECLQNDSRVRNDCESRETVIKSEQEVSISLENPAPRTLRCATLIETEYTQRNTTASVAGTIENHDCAASDGEFKLFVSVRDANLELKTLEFVESWQRGDDQPVSFKADYPIGQNVELVRVRSRQLCCTCADPPGE